MLVLFVILAGTFVAVVFYYNWCILKGMRAGENGRSLAGPALQIGVALFALTVWFSPIEAVLFGLFPPLALFKLHDFGRFWEFLQPVVFCALFAAVIAGLVAFRIARPVLAGIVLVTFGVTSLLGAELRSRRLMCSTALDLGYLEIRRNSIFWTLRNAPAEFQFGFHAMVVDANTRLAWSYRETGWYQVPDSVRNSGVQAKPTRCVQHQ